MTARVSFVILCTLIASTAHADDKTIAEADRLFAEGLALRDTNLQQSCDKFAASFELNPQAIGTLLNVALCDEKLGRIASAVEKFTEARQRAAESQLPDYIAAAEEHITALTPDLPHVEIKFLGVQAPGTRVLINDRVIARLAEPIAVDPGELVIVVSAPGRLAFETRLIVQKRDAKTVDVPELKKGVTVKSSRRTVGKITTISGGAAVATGIVLGLVARSRYNEQFDSGACVEATKQCTAEGQTETEKARTLGWVGTGIGTVGVAAVGVGLWLWLTAPKESTEPRGVSVIPQVTGDSAGVWAVGRF